MINIVGHRGAAGYALENTINSFSIAHKMGVKMIEIDIQITKDGKLVVFHDNIINRISNGSGYLRNFTWDELSKFTLLDGSKILALEDVCVFCKKNGLKLFAELKGESICNETVNVLTKYFPTDEFIIGSFFHKQVHKIKDENPQIQTCIIFEGYTTNMHDYIVNNDVDYISLGFESVTDSVVNELKKSKREYIFWTLDHEIEIRQAISYKPFAIITNYPDKAMELTSK